MPGAGGWGLYLKPPPYLVRLDTLDPHIAGEGIGAKARLCVCCVSAQGIWTPLGESRIQVMKKWMKFGDDGARL